MGKTLNAHVKASSPSNVDSEVSVEEVKQLENGDLEVSYTCTGVKDHKSAKSSLHEGSNSTALKNTVAQCSHSDRKSGNQSQASQTKPSGTPKGDDHDSKEKKGDNKKPEGKKGDDRDSKEKKGDNKKPEGKKGNDKGEEG